MNRGCIKFISKYVTCFFFISRRWRRACKCVNNYVIHDYPAFWLSDLTFRHIRPINRKKFTDPNCVILALFICVLHFFLFFSESAKVINFVLGYVLIYIIYAVTLPIISKSSHLVKPKEKSKLNVFLYKIICELVWI